MVRVRMRRTFRHESAGDLASLLAAVSVGSLALVTWMVADVVGDRLGIQTAGLDDFAQDTTTVDRAELNATPKHASKSKRGLNVVLITVDTLRSDLGFAGYPRPVTPNLDALAAKSTVFERAYSMASYTAKSVGPMMIGK